MIFKEVKKSTNLFAAAVSGDSWTIQLDLEPVDNPSFASLKAGTLVSQPPLRAPRASHNFSTPLSSGGDRVFQPPAFQVPTDPPAVTASRFLCDHQWIFKRQVKSG